MTRAVNIGSHDQLLTEIHIEFQPLGDRFSPAVALLSEDFQACYALISKADEFSGL